MSLAARRVMKLGGFSEGVDVLWGFKAMMNEVSEVYRLELEVLGRG